MTLVFCPNDCGYFADFCPKDLKGTESLDNNKSTGRYPRPSQGQALNWPEGMRPIPGPGGHRSSNPHTGYAGRRTSEGLGNCVSPRREVRAKGRGGGAPYRSPACRRAGEAGNRVQPCGSRRPGRRRRWTGAARPALTGTDASAASGCSFWLFVPGVRSGCSFRVFVLVVRSGCSFLVVRSGCSFWLFVPGVRDDPGLVPRLIRELVRRAAAEAALDPDVRKIPGTEAAWPRRRASHSGPLRGQNGVLAPWVNFGTPRARKGAETPPPHSSAGRPSTATGNPAVRPAERNGRGR